MHRRNVAARVARRAADAGIYVDATTLEGPRQALARGPVASQEAIKLLSGDGGGFFNANSAHPFKNPTALTGLFEPLLIFLIGAGLTNTFGRMVGDPRQGWIIVRRHDGAVPRRPGGCLCRRGLAPSRVCSARDR
jgi:hypothetical protein